MAQSKKLLSFGITGSVSPATPLNYTPSYLLSMIEVQKLLIETAQQPKSKEDILKALSDTDITLKDLVKSGLLKQAGEHYRLSFILYLKEYLKIIRSVTGEMGQDLANAILEQRVKFTRLLEKTANPHLVKTGCFADPYSPNHRFQGFIPAVWNPDVLPEETTF